MDRQRVLGLLFYLETIRESAEALIENCWSLRIG
jgi:hypothetical protein